jgi:hypothetical protein
MRKIWSWFTLVEVVVVTIILSILWAVGFISYANYLIWVRDTKRLWDLTAIHDGLQSSITKWDLVNPDSSIVINAWWILVWNQWYAWAGILNLIGLQDGGWKDPKNDSYYTYYLYKDKKSFQLMAWFEDSPDKLKSTSLSLPLFPEAYAWTPDYSVRFPKVYGKQLWVLTNTLKVPVQELQTGALDIATTTNTYIAYLNGTTTVSWTWWVLLSTLPNANCKKIRDNGNGNGDGLYRIDPSWNGWYDAWCDMTTDGGGWTLVGRSVIWWTGNFWFKTNTWDLLNESIPYSVDATNIFFTEVLFWDYLNSKKWGNYIYKKSVPSGFIQNSLASALSITTTSTVRWSCTWNPSMFYYMWFTNLNTTFFLRDNWTTGVYWLLPNWFATNYSNCNQWGNLNWLQGMIMIR